MNLFFKTRKSNLKERIEVNLKERAHSHSWWESKWTVLVTPSLDIGIEYDYSGQKGINKIKESIFQEKNKVAANALKNAENYFDTFFYVKVNPV